MKRREDTQSRAVAENGLAGRRLEPATFFCWTTVVAALIAALVGAAAETVILGLTAVVLVLLRRLSLPRVFELSAAVGFLLQGWGNALWLFERIGWYDKLVHFLTPLLMVPPLYVLLARAELLPPLWGHRLRRGTLGVLVVTIALGTALAGIWELIEGTSDRLLGTGLAHGYFETIDDLYSSVLGSVAAGALLAWAVTSRGEEAFAGGRAPAEALVEPE